MAKVTLTVELTEDLAREFKAFCKEQCTDVQDGLAMLVMGSLQDPDVFERACDASTEKWLEDEARNPNDYPGHTPRELFSEWDVRDAMQDIETFEREALVVNG